MKNNIKNLLVLLKSIISWGEQENKSDDNYDLLTRQLIEVLQYYYDLEDLSDENDYPECPPFTSNKICSYVEINFPEFSYYNIPSDVTQKICETEILVGDPTDDLSDIITDFKEILWYHDNTSIENTVWYFKFGYTSHWGIHLNDLLWYLYNLKFGL